MNEERRSEPRYASEKLQLLATDALRSEIIGSVANLSERGLMLNTTTALEKDGVLQLALSRSSTPDAIIVELALRITWTSPAMTPGNCWAGGKTIAISEGHAKTLRALLEEAQTTNSSAK